MLIKCLNGKSSTVNCKTCSSKNYLGVLLKALADRFLWLVLSRIYFSIKIRCANLLISFHLLNSLERFSRCKDKFPVICLSNLYVEKTTIQELLYCNYYFLFSLKKFTNKTFQVWTSKSLNSCISCVKSPPICLTHGMVISIASSESNHLI